MRFDPTLKQVPKKKVNATFTGKGTLLWLGSIPNYQPGYGTVLFLTAAGMFTIGGTQLNTPDFTTDSLYRRWSTCLYNGSIYYTNELNPIRCCDGSTDVAVANAPSARYVIQWEDHLVAAYVTYQGNVYANRIMISDLYRFNVWQPDNANEADHYDFVEWQTTDYPYVGITGLGKLGKFLWVYTPTAIVPLVYTGRQAGVFQIVEEAIFTGVGNTYPWSLAVMNNVHFFFDAVEKNFFAFNGTSPQPIGEPVKQYVKDNINTDPALASRMWACVDVNNTEVIWRFCSTSSTGAFDKLVRYNYRYNVWSTGSDENIHSFCGSIFRAKTFGELTGTLGNLSGVLGNLGLDGTVQPRLYGSVSGSDGKIYVEAAAADVGKLSADAPVLETGDLYYGHDVKEVDSMMPNASFVGAGLTVRAHGRRYLSDTIDWTSSDTLMGVWTASLAEGKLTFPADKIRYGQVLRYRFGGDDIDDLVFHAFCDGVYKKGAEK
jgi:hypothetical protein